MVLITVYRGEGESNRQEEVRQAKEEIFGECSRSVCIYM